MTLFDEQHALRDLHERYPSPGGALCVGDPPLVHHGLAFGQTVVAVKAVKECLEIAKRRGDTVSGDHLRAHLKEYEEWKRGRDRHRAAAASARTGQAATPLP